MAVIRYGFDDNVFIAEAVCKGSDSFSSANITDPAQTLRTGAKIKKPPHRGLSSDGVALLR